MYPRRIICGGQRGADQAGLWAAIDVLFGLAAGRSRWQKLPVQRRWGFG
jgi:hypothetical protein